MFDHLCSGNNLHLIIMGYENGLIIFRNPFVPNAFFLYPLFSTHSFSSISREMVHLEKIVKGYKELTMVDTVNSSKYSSMSKNSHLLRGLYYDNFLGKS